jgi:hypothetical protein
VDVYDGTFQPVKLSDHYKYDNQPFMDNRLPGGYVPFNVQAIGDDIVVTYTLLQEGSTRETDGPGLGCVNIYSSTARVSIMATG